MFINWCMYQSTSKRPYQCCPLILQKIVSYIYGESFLWLLITVVREKMFEIYSPSWIFSLILSLTCSFFWWVGTHPKAPWGEAVQLDVDAPWSCASDSPLTGSKARSPIHQGWSMHQLVECKGQSFVAFLAGAFPLLEVVALPPALNFSTVTLACLVWLASTVVFLVDFYNTREHSSFNIIPLSLVFKLWQTVRLLT